MDRWWEIFNEVQEFHEEHGHLSFPVEHPAYSLRLRTWMTYQRYKATTLTDVQLQALESIHYKTVKPYFGKAEEKWRLKIMELQQDPKAKDDPAMKKWIRQQKWLKSKGRLSEDRVKQLEECGVDWKAKRTHNANNAKKVISDRKWSSWFEKLKEYRNRYGNTMVPHGKLCPNKALASWVKRQRMEYHQIDQDGNSLLARERIDKLNEIGFVWSLRTLNNSNP